MPLTRRTKGILSIIGGFSLHLIIGSLYSWSALNVYYASYLHYYDSPNIKIVDVYFLMPSIIFLQYITLGIGVKLADMYNPRIPTIISAVFMISAYSTLLFSTKYIVVVMAFIVFGVGDGIGFLVVIRNCWKYFPNNKGFINGIIVGGLGLSSAIINPIADFVIINPHHSHVNDTGFYPKETADNMKTFLLSLTIIFSILAIIAMTLTIPYNEFEEVTEEVNTISDFNEKGILNSDDNNNIDTNYLIPSSNEKNFNLIKVLLSAENIKGCCGGFGAPFFCVLLTNTNRYFGIIHELDESTLEGMSCLSSFINGISRFIWGFLFDKYSFKTLFMIILALELIVSCSIYFIVKFIYLYVIENFVIAFCGSGCFSMFAPMFNKVFGVPGAKIFGFSGMFIGGSSFIGPVGAKLGISKMEDYLIIYMISAGIIIASMVVVILIKGKSVE